jgi:hypothetical protein
MSKPSAVIDISLLRAICEQPSDKLDQCFNTLLKRYVLVAPSILVDEVWVQRATTSVESAEVIENMVACLLHLRDAWIDEPLEISFIELVKRQPIDILPQPPKQVSDSFFTLRPDDPALGKWVKQRLKRQKEIIRDRVREHAKVFDTQASVRLASEQDFFDRFMRPKFEEMVSDPTRRRRLLEGVLGLAFRARHPESSKEIDTAFDEYSPASYDRYPVTLNCIMAAMFYWYAPLCKVALPNGSARKITGRAFGDQRNNLYDEMYVQSALLCARLATRDEGMRNIMELFRASGLWNGQTVFIEPNSNQDLAVELRSALR